eukprot:2018906-Pleurochrysis_carterae.AAC.1
MRAGSYGLSYNACRNTQKKLVNAMPFKVILKAFGCRKETKTEHACVLWQHGRNARQQICRCLKLVPARASFKSTTCPYTKQAW